MARALVVISFDDEGPQRMAEMLDELRINLSDLPNVKCYGAVGDLAHTVLRYFREVE